MTVDSICNLWQLLAEYKNTCNAHRNSSAGWDSKPRSSWTHSSFFFFPNGSRGRWFSGQAAPPAVSEETTATNSPSAKPPAASGECVLVCLYTVFKTLQHGPPLMAAKAQSQQTRNNFHMELQHPGYLDSPPSSFLKIGVVFCFFSLLHPGINTRPCVTSSVS